MCSGTILFGNPQSGAFFIPIGRPHAVHHKDAIVRVVLHAGWKILEPTVPPAQGLLQKADSRLRHREMRILVHPWANNALGTFQPFDNLWHRVFVSIAPTTNCQHLGLDGTHIFYDRSVPPVGVAALVAQPDSW